MNIKIGIAAHKVYRMPSEKSYLPIQVGAHGKDDIGYTRDDIGDSDVVHCCRAVCRGWQAVCGLQAFQEVFQNNGCRNFAVGCFWNYERCGGFDNVIAHNHVAAHRQTVHEVCVIGYCHVF